MTPQDFIAKWQRANLSERSAAQQHFLDLCELLGQPKPAAADPEGAWYTFERGAHKTGGGEQPRTRPPQVKSSRRKRPSSSWRSGSTKIGILPVCRTWRFGEREDNDLFARHRANIVVQAHDLDAGYLLDHGFQGWPHRFD